MSRLAAILVSVLLLAACGGNNAAQPGATIDPSGGAAAAGGNKGTQLSGDTFTTRLTGNAEVPGPGAKDARGQASVDFMTGQLCFELSVEGIKATAAHIHEGGVDEAGPVVVGLNPPAGGSSKGCVDAEQSQLDQIKANPSGFYVNVHTEEFPDGAVRGQLGAPS
ncbi:MAG: CHRD domain-containing protein [Actinomycetota bacterium]|nr:CHRD domain-containing protein [Actinomycetota bacterium]